MTDERELTSEPERDPLLRAALSDALGETPRDVDWPALARRTRSAAAFRLRARARQAQWWELAGRWSRRALPVGALAAAAALLLAVLTPRASEGTTSEAGDPVAAVVTSGSSAQAVETVAAATLDESWLWNAAVGGSQTAGGQ